MKRYRLDVDAKDDLASIYKYVASQNRVAADRLIDNLKQRLRLLAAQPLLGQLRRNWHQTCAASALAATSFTIAQRVAESK